MGVVDYWLVVLWSECVNFNDCMMEREFYLGNLVLVLC